VADARAIVEDTPRLQAPRLPAFAAAQQVVPPNFDPIDAGMFITFKETLSWMHQLGPLAGRSVLILGSGPVGLCFTRIAKYLGAALVVVVGRREERLDLARRLGADAGINTAREEFVAAARALTDGAGIDRIVEAIGDTDLLVQAPRALADGGQIAVYGVPAELQAGLRWADTPSNWQLRFIRPYEEQVHDLALALVRLGFIDLRSFVSHTLPLADVAEAFRLLDAYQALKPVIVMGQD
jgi:threonine dehydrogenase-like Zn-dependent dehydrogenase